MSTILEYLGTDHHQCDAHFASAETAVAQGRWTDAREAAQRFLDAMAQHFEMEETVLFPAFEARTGIQSGPTAVMRMEHAQMRELMDGMAQAVEAQDAGRFLGLSETLNMLMQQHNMKEENMLYPMADRILGDARDGLLEAMQACAKPHPA